MTPLYVGPSWAARSYETIDDTDTEITNLFLEWKIEVKDFSRPSYTNGMLLNKVKNHLSKNPQDKESPIIWIFAEPLTDSFIYDEPKIENLLEKENWWEVRNRVKKYLLDDIAALGNPIALIGSHSDVPSKSDYENVTIIHPSWQKFLAQQIGIEIIEGFGADVIHRFIIMDRSIKPCYDAVKRTSDLFSHWHQLEMHNLFQICHPNLQGNKIFAKFIESDVKQWLSQFN